MMAGSKYRPVGWSAGRHVRREIKMSVEDPRFGEERR